MTLYTDGRLPEGATDALQLASWDLPDIYDAGSAAQRLTPDELGFDPFMRPGTRRWRCELAMAPVGP